MASKEEIQKKNIAEANDALAEQLSLASKIQDQMSFVLKNYKEKLSLDKNSVDLTKKALDLTKSLKSEYNSVKDVQNDIKKNQKLQNDIARQKLALEKEGGESLKKELDLHKTKEGSLAKAQSKLAQMNQDKAAGRKVDAALYKQAQDTVTKKQEQLTFAKENLSFEAQQVVLLEKSNEELQQGSTYLNDQLDMQQNLVKSQSLFTSALSGANKLLQKMGFGDLGKKLGLDAASEKAKEMTYRLTDGGKKALGTFGKMRVGIASFGAALKSALGPMALIGMATSLFHKFKEKGKEAMDYMAEISSETANLTRELGFSAANGAKVAGQARAIGGAMGFTHEQSVAAAGAIYGQIQGTEQLGAETMKTFMKLNVHGGVSGDVLGKIYNISKLTGQEAGKVAEEIASQAQESLKTMKVNVSMKAVMDGVSKVSSRVALNFKGSGTAITAAVVQSKKLGIEMSKVEDIANSLLNIEDSIAAEMEAELLTGKDLNLEKAREAALNGDNATLMEELANQGITAADYSKMNRIQQDALGKALGMNGEEMSDMLLNQKKNEASNQDTLSLQKDSIAAMTSMASLAEGLKNQEDAKKAAMGETGKLYMEFHHIMHEISMKLAPILNAAFAGLWKILKPILQGVSDWLSDSKVVEQITATITAVFSKLAEIIGRVWAIISPIRQAIFDIVMTALPPFLTIMETLWSALQPTFQALVELAKNMVPIIADILTKVAEVIGEILVGLQPVFEGLGNLAMNILPIIQNIFTFISPVVSFIADMVGRIVGFIVGIITPITEFVGKLIAGNKEFSTMEKIIGSIVLAIGGMLGVMKMVQGVSIAIKAIKIATNAESRKEYAQLVKNQAIQVKDFFKSMGGAVAKIFSAFGAIPFGIGIPLAIAAAAGLGTLAYSYFNKGNDVMSPGDGYGSRTLMGPEGAIRLNNKDTVIAGTNLFDKEQGARENKSSSGGTDNSAVVAELQRVSSLLQQILSKEGGVYLDGNKVGATIALSNYQQQ